MRTVIIGLWLWLVTAVAVGVPVDEPAAGQPEADESQVTESTVIESQAETEEQADADIRQIEAGVSGADDIEEFVPKKPLSADKAIALPSDI